MTEALYSQSGRPLGIVIGGSLNEGIRVKLDSNASVEDMAVGRIRSDRGGQAAFLSV